MMTTSIRARRTPFNLTTSLASLLVITIGLLVLAGWAFDVTALKSVRPGWVTMKPNAALGFVLCGAALWLLHDEGAARWRRSLALSCAAVVALLGLLTLSEYLGGWNLGIDEILFRDDPSNVTPHPGRMAFNAAGNFLLAGGALWLLETRTRAGRLIGQAATVLIAFVALLALIGYLYGAAFLLRLSPFTSMALHASLTFLTLAVGLLASRPEHDLMRLAASASAGGLMLRRIWPALVLILLMLGWLRLSGERAGFYDADYGTALLVIAFIVIFSVLLWVNARALNRQETARRVMDERLRVTLASIGDGVIATDAQGRVSFINGVAERLTGWSQDEAIGRALPEVFHIVNEQSRQPVDDPATRVLREGAVIGLANHTVLVARDGRATAIDDSGAPIRDAAGAVIGAVLVFRDITGRRQTETALRESEERYRLVAETASDVILSIDETSTILYVNRAVEHVFGYPVAELIGQPLTLLMPEYLRHLHRAGVERYLATGRRHLHWESVEVPGLRRDGREIQLELSFGEYLRAGRPVFIGIARDATARKKSEAERESLIAREQELRQRAEEASRFKDEFLAVVSHELRTPLNAINGYAQLLRENLLAGEDVPRALETIERNAKAQARLIDDLLDTSRIITGQMRLELRRFELRTIIEAALDTVRPAAQARGVELQAEYAAEARQIVADAARLQQIVWNLLSNAVKFTPRHGRVAVRLAQVNARVEISVTDTGAGIHPELLPFVFDRFRQGDNSARRRHQGLGLGLAIVRHLVELHGGTVAAASGGEGLGATFTINLPIRTVTQDAPAETDAPTVAPAEQAARANLDGLRALVVDDEADSLAMLTTLLTGHGVEVKACSSAADALAELPSFQPQVLISDIGLPELDGYDLIRHVRALPPEQGGQVPAIALTAYADAPDRARAFSSGYQAHLAKPVEPVELALIIATLTGRLDKSRDEDTVLRA